MGAIFYRNELTVHFNLVNKKVGEEFFIASNSFVKHHV